jgi:hypothetical protein
MPRTKPPKRRFSPGDRFEYDGSNWTLIHMFRLLRYPGIWFHVLEEDKPPTAGLLILETLVDMEGKGYTGPAIEYTEFRSESDARDHFRGRVMRGNQMTVNTQELICFRRLPPLD